MPYCPSQIKPQAMLARALPRPAAPKQRQGFVLAKRSHRRAPCAADFSSTKHSLARTTG